MCDYDCLRCIHADCIEDTPPEVDLDEYMQFGLDWYEVRGQEVEVQRVTVEPVDGLEEAIEADLRAWCERKRVKPRTWSDVAILRRAMVGNFSGKKLEKALYKVRHREKYLESKARTRARAKTARKKRL